MLIAALVLAAALQDPPPAPPPVIRLDPQIQRWLDNSRAALRGLKRENQRWSRALIRRHGISR